MGLLACALMVLALNAPAASASVTTSPSLSLSANQTDPAVNQSVTFTATASGSGCGDPSPVYNYVFYVDGQEIGTPSSSNTYTTSWDTPGRHQVYAWVEDMNAGQCPTATAVSSTINVGVFNALGGSISQEPSGSATQGDTDTFTAGPTGGDGTYTYAWSFSGGSGPFTDGTGSTIDRRLLSTGPQTTWVQITDGARPAHTVVESITTNVNPAPRLGGDIAQSPGGSVLPGTTVQFTAPDVGGVPPYRYNWDFGCTKANGAGTDGSTQTVTRAFPNQGSFYTCVTVTDSAVPAHVYAVAIDTTVGAPAPPSGCAQTVVLSSIAEARGCFTKQSDGSYASSSTITLNGVPLTPVTGSITVTPGSAANPGGSVNVGDVQLALGEQILYEAALDVKLPDPSSATTTGSGGSEATFITESAKPISLFGLKVGGTFTLGLGKDASGYYSTFTLTIDLPSIFKNASGSGGLTGTGSIRVNQDETIEYNGAQFDASGAEIGGVGVKNVCFSLIPGSSADVSSCPVPSLGESATGDAAYVSCSAAPGSGDHWDATAEIELPTPTKADIAVFGGGTGTTLTDLGGFGTNLNVPIAEDVFLRTVGAGFCFTSPLTIRGDVGVGLFPVPDKGDAADITGTLIYTGATSTSPWSLYLGGTVDVFGNQIGSGHVTVYGNGNFDFDAQLSFKPVSFLSLSGGVSGWVEPAYRLFDIEGNVSICVTTSLGTSCASANGVVSSTGVAGCINIAGIGVGAGEIWNGPVNLMAGSCSIGNYQATKLAGDASAGSRTLRVARGTRGVVVGLTGSSAPPGVLITGPHGTRIDSPAGVGLQRGRDYLIIRDPQNNRTNILLAHPAAGAYTFTLLQRAGAVANSITSLQTAGVLAPFSGRGRVTSARRGRRVLKLTYVLPTGAQVRLVEHGSHVERTIVRVLHGRPCGGGHGKLAGGQQLCAVVAFTPAAGAGGRRTIEAIVQRGGLLAANVTVARYAAPALRRPAKAAKVQIRRNRTTLTIAWSAINGVTSYGVVARLTDGRVLSYLPAHTCRELVIPRVARGTGVRAQVVGIRLDGVHGRIANAELKPGKARGGAGGRVVGPRCR